MYVDTPIEEAVKLDKVKLCYIDEINKTYYDFTPEAKAYRETDEWKEQDRLREEKLRREGCMSSNDEEFGLWANPILRRGADCQDYPNPDYIEGKQEYYAYFTPAPMDRQWGDDWDDKPYEHNAEIPYDDYYDEDGMKVEVEMIRVPFMIPDYDEWSVKLPKDWGGYNSEFSVEEINAGAVAWIYDSMSHTSIHAGCTPKEFFDKIDRMIKARNEGGNTENV